MSSNVLVVEDYADLRTALVSALSRAQYTCDEVRTSEDALRLLRDNRYNTVLLSTRMPIGDDPVVRYLLAEDASKSTKVIVMTDGEDETDDFPSLAKPFNYEQLFATLKR